MTERLRKCLDEHKLVKVPVQPDLIQKELTEAAYDLKTAETSIREKNFKWATVQAYYTMFHTAKALVLKEGYLEKSHACLLTAFHELYVQNGRIERKFYEHFKDGMDLRHDADYGMVYSDSTARQTAKWASDFLTTVEKILEEKSKAHERKNG